MRCSAVHVTVSSGGYLDHEHTLPATKRPFSREIVEVGGLVIRLRDMIERGCSHPVFGPLVILLLVLLLAAVSLHVALEGAEAAMELGQLCVTLAVVLGPLLVFRLRRVIVDDFASPAEGRGPPARRVLLVGDPPSPLTLPARIPLRR